MKPSNSGVASSAAKIRSPSFSRSASSTTTTARPAAMSATARSIESRNISATVRIAGAAMTEQSLGVLGEYVHLEVHRIAHHLATEHGGSQGLRDQADLEPIVAHRTHCQRHSVDGD